MGCPASFPNLAPQTSGAVLVLFASLFVVRYLVVHRPAFRTALFSRHSYHPLSLPVSITAPVFAVVGAESIVMVAYVPMAAHEHVSDYHADANEQQRMIVKMQGGHDLIDPRLDLVQIASWCSCSEETESSRTSLMRLIGAPQISESFTS